jgi:uncharacterized protein (DUF488 family)
MNSDRLFSIGHSIHDLAFFIGLLRRAGVTAVADVRSQPFSKRCPHFSRRELKRALRADDIAYAFLGDRLGGRPEELSLYSATGRVDYERVRATETFQAGLDALLDLLDSFAVAMLCSEPDPLACHRGLMITPALVERGFAPLHLRWDGGVETTAEMEQRLLAETKVGEGVLDGLFAAQVTAEDRRQMLAEAYRIMAERKAYRLEREHYDPAVE